MRRPLVVLAAVYGLGLILARFLYPLSRGEILIFGGISVLLVVFALFLMRRYFTGVQHRVAFLPLLFFLALCNYQFTAYGFQGNLGQFAGERVALTGWVAAEPVVYTDRTVYLLEAEMLYRGEGEGDGDGEGLKSYPAWGRVRLVVEEASKRAAEGTNGRYLYGDYLMVRGKLTVPTGPRNPGGFDQSKFLLSQGAGAQLYMTLGQGEVLPPPVAPGFKAALLRKVYALKSSILAHFQESLPSHQAALLGGILFGLRSSLPPAVEENFRAAGVSHLLAVSGLHVGLLALLTIRLFRILGVRGERVYLWSLPILGAFALFTGLRPAVLRALLMFSFLVVAQILGRDRDFLSALSLAALISLLINPFFLFMPGFQLSYAGILFIVYLYERLKGLFTVLPSFLQGIAAVSLAAQLGVAPLTGYYFQQVSLVALVANLLLVACMMAVLGGGLLGAVLFVVWPLGSTIILILLKPLLTLFLVITEALSALPLATLHIPKGSLLFIILYYLAFIIYFNKDVARKTLLFLQCSPKKLAIAVLIFLCLLSAVSLSPHIQKGNSLEVTFLDVGQGTSVFVLTPSGRSILLDAGGALFPQSRDPGEDVLIPFLRYKGVKKLDLLFISHPHADHYGGAIALLKSNPPHMLVVGSLTGEAGYLELLRLAGEKRVEIYVAAAGDRLLLDRGIELQVYHPPRGKTWGGSSTAENNDSLVLRIVYNEISFLFTGDIEEDTEILLKKKAVSLESTFLQVPHHGSGTSSTQAFLDTANAKVNIISVGANPFGHPAEGVLMRLEGQGGDLYRTDWHGAVTIETDGVGYTIRTMLEAGHEWKKTMEKINGKS